MMQLPDDTISFLSEWVPRIRNNSFSYLNLVGQDLDPQVRRPVRSVTASAAVNPLDDLVLVSGNTTMTLESAVACDGRRHTFIKTDSGNTMTIAGTPSIDGGASIAAGAQYAGVEVISNGTTWNSINVALVGYAKGGGTVTQLTSKSTGVTIDKISGQIITHNAALAAGVEVSFTVTNSTVAVTDVIVVSLSGGAFTNNAYSAMVSNVSAGSFQITLSNWSAGSLSEPVSINYAVIKAVHS